MRGIWRQIQLLRAMRALEKAQRIANAYSAPDDLSMDFNNALCIAADRLAKMR